MQNKQYYFNHYNSFWPVLANSRIDEWQSLLPPLLETIITDENNGNLQFWQEALHGLLSQSPSSHRVINESVVQAKSDPLRGQNNCQWEAWLKALRPWRKGPYEIEGIYIDTEWRSDWKWDRVLPHLTPLKGRKVLDIGCGSGYHLWRMLGEGARFAVGVDPSLLFMSQFLVMKHFMGEDLPAWFLPITLEQLPVVTKSEEFDTVFSMGVLYHRRSPIDHILDAKKHLKRGGELVLETLVIPESFGQILLPEARYAQMNNVWFLPNVPELIRWMERCGFNNVRCVDLNQTQTDEQRATDWMQWKSLQDFLDPEDPSKTVEGYPSPLRAVIIGEKP